MPYVRAVISRPNISHIMSSMSVEEVQLSWTGWCEIKWNIQNAGAYYREENRHEDMVALKISLQFAYSRKTVFTNLGKKQIKLMKQLWQFPKLMLCSRCLVCICTTTDTKRIEVRSHWRGTMLSLSWPQLLQMLCFDQTAFINSFNQDRHVTYDEFQEFPSLVVWITF